MNQYTLLGEDKLNYQSGKSNSVELSFSRLKDNQTNQFVFHCQSQDVSGYGDTEEKALEMLKFNINQAFAVPL